MIVDRMTDEATLMWGDEFTTSLLAYRRGQRFVIVYQHDESGFLGCTVIPHSSGGDCRPRQIKESDATNASTALDAVAALRAVPVNKSDTEPYWSSTYDLSGG